LSSFPAALIGNVAIGDVHGHAAMVCACSATLS
jgi:hypothetical protein